MTAYAAAPPTESRVRRMLAPGATIGALSVATLALRLRDPHEQGSWGFCPSAALGWWCPGCGGLRAVNDLTHGQVLEAASSNLLLVTLIPVGLAALVLWTRDRWRGRSPRLELTPRQVVTVVMASVIVALAFGVLRNLPAGAWLAP